jgi:hypothetical protein
MSERGRGDWYMTREPDLDSDIEREALALVLLDSATCDAERRVPGWEWSPECTRRPGHRGDHVASNSQRIWSRWRNRSRG